MRSALAVLVFALILPIPGGAQSGALAAGARVRVTSPNDGLKRHVAIVTEIRDDTIVVAGSTGSRAIGLSNLTALEVSSGRRSRFFHDTGIGLGAGIVAGAVIGAVSYEECDAEGFMSCFLHPENRSEAAAWGAVVLGAVGTVSGAIVGAFHRTDRWERASLPAMVSIGPSRSGGVSLNFSRAF